MIEKDLTNEEMNSYVIPKFDNSTIINYKKWIKEGSKKKKEELNIFSDKIEDRIKLFGYCRKRE